MGGGLCTWSKASSCLIPSPNGTLPHLTDWDKLKPESQIANSESLQVADMESCPWLPYVCSCVCIKVCSNISYSYRLISNIHNYNHRLINSQWLYLDLSCWAPQIHNHLFFHNDVYLSRNYGEPLPDEHHPCTIITVSI